MINEKTTQQVAQPDGLQPPVSSAVMGNWTIMKRSALQEKLVALYLRLNGYLTTGLIIHSPNDTEIEGEIDIIGVRFCGHSQPDRIINCSDALEIPTDSEIDIIVGEVKGKKETLQFNESLRLYPDRLEKLFKWIGIINEINRKSIIDEFVCKVTPKEIQSSESFPVIKINKITLRPILFAPDRPQSRSNQIKYIHGSELIDYCWKCFRPENRRETCETEYKAVNNWGEQFERLVGFFKDKNEPGDMTLLYRRFKIEE